MLGAQSANMQSAVASAVKLVNDHAGQAAIRLRFNSTELSEVDFVANSASLQGERFVFTAGFESFGGTLSELADIHAALISRRRQ